MVIGFVGWLGLDRSRTEAAPLAGAGESSRAVSAAPDRVETTPDEHQDAQREALPLRTAASELVIARLMRRAIGWMGGRHHDLPVSYPQQARRGPVVFVTNRFAGSDGDIVTAAAQNLGLGPVVGERSWGGVVGIDGRFTLVDGTEVTQPRYWTYFDKQGFGLENHGVDPDVVVEIGPGDWESDADVQLDAALGLAMEALAERPAARPPAFEPPRFA